MSQNGKGDNVAKRTNYKNFYANIDNIDWSTPVEDMRESPPQDYQDALRRPFFFEEYPHMTGVWRIDKYRWELLRVAGGTHENTSE